MRISELLFSLLLCSPLYCQVTVVVDQYGVSSMTYAAVNYSGGTCSGCNLFGSTQWQAVGGGAITMVSGLTNASAVRTFSNTGNPYFQMVYNNGASYQFTMRSDFQSIGLDTVKQTITVTNQDPGGNNLVAVKNYTAFNAVMPGTSTQFTSGVNFNLSPYAGQAVINQPVVGMLSGAWGAFAWWRNNPGSTFQLSTSYSSSGQTQFTVSLNTQYYPYPSQTNISYNDSIASGQSKVYEIMYRFGSSDSTAIVLGDAGIQEFREAFPPVSKQPDRRPIASWFMSEGTTRDSSNPRGWFNDPAIDVNPLDYIKQATFSANVLSRANTFITFLNNLSSRPQGVILWDVEGGEMDHAFTYVGDPVNIASYAPEMDAAVDPVMSAFRNAGYRVGVTVRPQRILVGSSLPGTCTNTQNADIYFKIDEPVFFRGYACNTPNTWTQPGASVPGGQHDLTTDQETLDELSAKISYAINRWGVSMFYIDSSVYYGGHPITNWVLRQLSTTFPNALFLNEFAPVDHGSTASAFKNLALGETGDSVQARRVYPESFAVIAIQDGDLTANRQALINGNAAGDTAINMLSVFTGRWNTYASIAAEAATLNATVAMTDRGQPRTFRSAPGTSFTYPVVARVYFSDTVNNLASSTTYCTRRATDSCYLNGVLQPTATLDLSTTPYWQLRYYDFAGNLVSNPGNYGTIN